VPRKVTAFPCGRQGRVICPASGKHAPQANSAKNPLPFTTSTIPQWLWYRTKSGADFY